MFETTKPAFRRNQFGGSAGGPIVQNRMHFFATAERTRTDQFYTVTTGLPQFYSSVEGTFKQPLTTNLYLGRFDYQINNSQNLFARYAQEGEFLTCQGCGGITSRRPATTRTCRAAHWSSPTPGSGARGS